MSRRDWHSTDWGCVTGVWESTHVGCSNLQRKKNCCDGHCQLSCCYLPVRVTHRPITCVTCFNVATLCKGRGRSRHLDIVTVKMKTRRPIHHLNVEKTTSLSQFNSNKLFSFLVQSDWRRQLYLSPSFDSFACTFGRTIFRFHCCTPIDQ